MGRKSELDEGTSTAFPAGTTGHCFVQALATRDIAYRYLMPDEITVAGLEKRRIVAFDINGMRYFFTGICLRVSDPSGANVPGPIIDGRVGEFIRRKDWVKARLRKRGINVPNGGTFSRNSCDKAEAFFERFRPSLSIGVCVKPVNGHEGDQVHVGIHDLSSFRIAFTSVGQSYRRILVEEAVSGTVYRFTWVASRVVAIRFGLPANVKGDGIHTIAELVDIKNIDRRRNPCLRRHMIQLGQKEYELLESVGLHEQSVPSAGQIIWLSATSNRHQGADPVDATDSVHVSYIELVDKIVKQFPGLVLCGADIVIKEASVPATNDNYYVLELNRCPGFSAHHYPWRGRSRDVAGAILDYLASTKQTGAPHTCELL
jgi:cyanophycin synthetase